MKLPVGTDLPPARRGRHFTGPAKGVAREGGLLKLAKAAY